jgi:hypothetical protein
MSSELNLSTLLKEMQPVKQGVYAFCVLDDETYRSLPACPLCTFQEAEGLTVIIDQASADTLGLPYTYSGTLITLNVFSSLDAVGFLARISTKLAAAGIGLNAFSPVHHDHIFVRPSDADRAMELLWELSRETV